MKLTVRIFLAVVVLSGFFFGALHWVSRPQGAGFVLEPNGRRSRSFREPSGRWTLPNGAWRTSTKDKVRP